MNRRAGSADPPQGVGNSSSSDPPAVDRRRRFCRVGGPMTLPHYLCEGWWPSPNPPWSFRGLHIGVRSALVSLMSTSQRLWGGPREHVIYKGSPRGHFIFRVTSWREEEARMTTLLGRRRFDTLFAKVCGPPRTLPGASGPPHRVRSARVSFMSTSQRPWGGPREHVIYEGSSAHPIFAALACVKCVEEARIAIGPMTLPHDLCEG